MLWIILGLIFLFIALKNLEYGIYFIILFLPSYLIRFKIFSIPFTFLEVLILLLFLIWCWRVYQKKGFSGFNEVFIKNKFWLFILTFVFVGFISVLVSDNWRAGAGIYKAYIIEPILFFFVFVNVINRKDLTKLLYVLSLQVLIISIYGFLQKIFKFGLLVEKYNGKAVERITSFFEYPNAIGLFLSPILTMIFIFLVKEFLGQKQSVKKNIFVFRFIFLLISFVFGILALFFARSEAGLLAVVLSIFLFCVFYNKPIRIFAGILVVFWLVVFLFEPKFFSLVKQKVFLQDFSGQIRRIVYKESWAMLKQNWVFGVGLSGYQSAMIPYHKQGYLIFGKWQPVEIFLYPHNIFLNFWSEMGIAGLLLVVGLFVYIFMWCFKNWHRFEAKFVFFSFLTLIIHGLVDVPFFKNDLSVLFWILCAIFYIFRFPQYEIFKND